MDGRERDCLLYSTHLRDTPASMLLLVNYLKQSSALRQIPNSILAPKGDTVITFHLEPPCIISPLCNLRLNQFTGTFPTTCEVLRTINFIGNYVQTYVKMRHIVSEPLHHYKPPQQCPATVSRTKGST